MSDVLNEGWLQELVTANESLRDKVHSLESTLNSIADAVVVADHEGRFLYFNPVAEQILGIGLSNAPASEWTALYGCYLPDKVTPYPPEQLPLSRAMRGETVIGEEIFIRNPQRSAGVWISISARPVSNGHGAAFGGVVVFRDITSQKQASQTIELLSRALEQAADSVIITDRNGVIEYVNPAVSKTTGYTREELVGQTPRLLKSGRQDEEFYKDMWTRILAGGVYEGTLINRRKNGEVYWVEQTITPIKDAGGNITHFVSVAKDVTEKRWRREQEIQMRLARQVQQRFYPALPRSECGLDLAGRAYPADSTSGDYFDFLTMQDDSLGVAIGDVRGHGFSSALLMAEVRAYLRAFTQTEANLAEVLNRLNRALAADTEGDSFVTLLLARIELRTRSLVYGNAGHLPGYVLDPSGKVKALLESKHPPLGIFAEEAYSSSNVIKLEPGDLLVLLTDGITEARAADETEFAIERALEVVNRHRHRTAAEIVEELYRAVRTHTGDQRQVDDITCVVCKIAPFRTLVSGP